MASDSADFVVVNNPETNLLQGSELKPKRFDIKFNKCKHSRSNTSSSNSSNSSNAVGEKYEVAPLGDGS